jgi:hypothetical protein
MACPLEVAGFPRAVEGVSGLLFENSFKATGFTQKKQGEND